MTSFGLTALNVIFNWTCNISNNRSFRSKSYEQSDLYSPVFCADSESGLSLDVPFPLYNKFFLGPKKGLESDPFF